MACNIWRRFSNLFETSQSLFWASFGLVDLQVFELNGIKSFTRFWALLMFGSYSVINVIVLLNMLIAMMSNSYQIISERSDTEWKFARSRLWMSYFENSDVVPPPFNLIPTPTMMKGICGCDGTAKESLKRRCHVKAAIRHTGVMRLLVRRYVTAEQRKTDDFSITEDDVNEIRQDISSFRYELIDILSNNGMTTPQVNKADVTKVAGKKGRVMERRLLKDFQIGFVESVVRDALQTERKPNDVFSKIARAIGKRGTKKDWNAEVRKRSVKRDPIGQSDVNMRRSQHSIRKYILSHKDSMDPQKLVEYNPRLSEVTPATRVAYAKFKMNKIKKELDEMEKIDELQNSSQEIKDVKRTIDRIAYERWSKNVMKNRQKAHTVIDIDAPQVPPRKPNAPLPVMNDSIKSRTLPPRKFESGKTKEPGSPESSEENGNSTSNSRKSVKQVKAQLNSKPHQESSPRIENARTPPPPPPPQPSNPSTLPEEPSRAPPTIPKQLKSTSPARPPSTKSAAPSKPPASPKPAQTKPGPSSSSNQEQAQYVPSGKSKVTGQVRTDWI